MRNALVERTTTVLLAATVLAASGCAPGRETASRVLLDFVTAVQDQDLDALYCLLAGASEPDPAGMTPAEQRAAFDAWARARFSAYEEDRDRGAVELAGDGIVLVKTFALGKGTFYTVDAVRYLGGGTLHAETTLNFGYTQVNYSTLSPGTTFYLAASPPGRIVAVRVPLEHREISEEVLESVRLRWELARVPATPSCPEGWAVVSVEPLPDSATTATVTWYF